MRFSARLALMGLCAGLLALTALPLTSPDKHPPPQAITLVTGTDAPAAAAAPGSAPVGTVLTGRAALRAGLVLAVHTTRTVITGQHEPSALPNPAPSAEGYIASKPAPKYPPHTADVPPDVWRETLPQPPSTAETAARNQYDKPMLR